MSNYNNLKTAIDANIKQNGNQEITGPILNSVLNQMVNILGTGYQFAGVATLDPATNPGTPDAKVFYIANGKGKYTNFGGLEVTEDDVVVLYWDSAWHKVATGIASQAKLSELDSQIEAEATARTEADAELQTQINGKQEALTLTVKDNGNIVLANIQGQSKEFMPATPSGDPMHYAYVAAGAEYNENTGFWKIGTLDDLTNDELKYMYNIRLPYISGNDDGVYSWKTSRTIFPLNIYGEVIPFQNISMMFYSSNFLELPIAVNNTIMKFSGKCTSLFAKCKNLKYIRTRLKFDSLKENKNMFNLCSSLEEVLCQTNSSLYFNDCSKLSIKSVLYIIQNEIATSPITITLHADVYNRCMSNTDILAALEAHTNISLASA